MLQFHELTFTAGPNVDELFFNHRCFSFSEFLNSFLEKSKIFGNFFKIILECSSNLASAKLITSPQNLSGVFSHYAQRGLRIAVLTCAQNKQSAGELDTNPSIWTTLQAYFQLSMQLAFPIPLSITVDAAQKDQ